LECGIHGSVTINHNETKNLLIGQQLFLEIIEIEPEIAVVDGQVDRFVGLKIADNFLFGS